MSRAVLLSHKVILLLFMNILHDIIIFRDDVFRVYI